MDVEVERAGRGGKCGAINKERTVELSALYLTESTPSATSKRRKKEAFHLLLSKKDCNCPNFGV